VKGKFGFILERVEARSLEEFKKAAIDAGIADKKGRLKKHYRVLTKEEVLGKKKR